MRRTKIICTIGPGTESAAMLEKMVVAGMDVARINMSHASHDWTRQTVTRLREISERLNRPCAIMIDTQGPSIRTGDLPAPLEIKPGDALELVAPSGAPSGEANSVTVDYSGIAADLRVGDTVLVDNGVMRFRVVDKSKTRVRCVALTEGVLGNRRRINLPGVRVNLPAITEKDRCDIELGLELGVDFLALSFVREVKDIEAVRTFLEARRADVQVIAKIENQSAVNSLDTLIEASDGIIVARGDLGIECPFEELPIIQREIVKKCLRRGRSVTIATHMLESMIHNPMPTRAEVTDVAHAVYEQADALLLSAETSIGKYPLQCIEGLDRVARRIERGENAGYAAQAELVDPRQKMMRSAVVMANELQAAGLLVFTRRGNMPRFASWLRPQCSPIYAFTNCTRIRNQMKLLWGVIPFLIEFHPDPQATIELAEKVLRERGLLAEGSRIVVVTETLVNTERIDTVQMRVVR